MKKPLAVGDRVACYGRYDMIDGPYYACARPVLGRVRSLTKNTNIIEIEADKDLDIGVRFFEAHVKQCRRLVPKKKPLRAEFDSHVTSSAVGRQGCLKGYWHSDLVPFIGKTVHVVVTEKK